MGWMVSGREASIWRGKLSLLFIYSKNRTNPEVFLFSIGKSGKF
jgi:hypothetical protein